MRPLWQTSGEGVEGSQVCHTRTNLPAGGREPPRRGHRASPPGRLDQTPGEVRRARRGGSRSGQVGAALVRSALRLLLTPRGDPTVVAGEQYVRDVEITPGGRLGENRAFQRRTVNFAE